MANILFMYMVKASKVCGPMDRKRNMGWFVLELYTATPNDVTTYMTADIDRTSSLAIDVQDKSTQTQTIATAGNTSVNVHDSSQYSVEIHDVIKLSIGE